MCLLSGGQLLLFSLIVSLIIRSFSSRNLESEEGKKIMTQRSIQAEGVFVNLKQDYGYTRLRRRGESGVKEEIYLAVIGYNIRKYHIHKQRKKEKTAAGMRGR